MKNIRFEWNANNQEQIINRLGFGNPLQEFMAMTCLRYMQPYIPFDTGTLANTVTISTKPNKAELHFTQPYANKQYTHAEYKHNLEHHPLATSEWDKAMWTVYKDKINKEVDDYRKRLAHD